VPDQVVVSLFRHYLGTWSTCSCVVGRDGFIWAFRSHMLVRLFVRLRAYACACGCACARACAHACLVPARVCASGKVERATSNRFLYHGPDQYTDNTIRSFTEFNEYTKTTLTGDHHRELLCVGSYGALPCEEALQCSPTFSRKPSLEAFGASNSLIATVYSAPKSIARRGF
jgi:hypothetical protein